MSFGNSTLTESNSWRGREWLILAALTALALIIRLYGLDARSLWTDELHTVIALEKPLPELIRNRLAAGHLPTYFIMMKLWAGVAGMSDWALRFPSAVAGALLVPAAVFFGRPFFSRRLVLGLAVVGAVCGSAVWAGQEARMYALLGVTATLCHGYYLRTLNNPGKGGNWAGYYLLLLASVSLQPVMLLWYVAHLVFSFSVRRGFPRHARVALGVAAALLLILVPAAMAFGGAQQKFSGIRPEVASPWMIVTRLTAVAFGPDNDLRLLGYAGRAALVGLLAAAVVARRRQLRGGQAENLEEKVPLLRFCALTIAVPALLLWVGECFLPNVLGPWRYQIPSSVPLWALLLWSAGQLPVRWRAAAGLLIAVLMIGGLYAHWRGEGTGIREGVQYLAPQLQKSDVIIFPGSATLELALYRYGIPREVKLAPFSEDSSEGDLKAHLEGLRPSGERVWLVLYRLRERERKELLEQMSRLKAAGVAVPMKEKTFRFQKAEVLGYRLGP